MENVDQKIKSKTGEGGNKNIVKKTKYEEYVDVLFNKKVVRHNTKRIQK